MTPTPDQLWHTLFAWPNGISTGNLVSSAIWALPALAAWLHLHVKMSRRHDELLAGFAAAGFGIERLFGSERARAPRRENSRSTLNIRAILALIDALTGRAKGISRLSAYGRRVGRHAAKRRRKMAHSRKSAPPRTGERT